MKTEFKLLTILLYIFTPEDSDPSFIDAGKRDDEKIPSYLRKIKVFTWILLSILSVITLEKFHIL